MSEVRDVEAALRASLAEHARHAPTGAGLVDEIVAAAAGPTPTELRRAHRWGTWTLPLIAAGAVAAIAIALVAVTQVHHTADHRAPAVSRSVTAPTPLTTAPTPSAPSPSNSASNVPATAGGLKNFVVTDLTFVGPTHGWALGTADCLIGSGTCTAMMRTLDGKTWHRLTNPPVNIDQGNGCASQCAKGIRFANDNVGYAYGHSVFFMTTDGGATWKPQAGGADALETLDGNVIRVSSACSPGCPYLVQIATIGTSVWHSVSLPGAQAAMNSGVTLTRTGQRAFIDVFGHVAGGASDARSVMYASGDDGATWTRRGEPCPQGTSASATAEVDSVALTSAPDGSVTMLCTPRPPAESCTITSTDGGQTFSRGIGSLGVHGGDVLGAASANVLFVSTDVLYRSGDGGQTWRRAQQNGVGPLHATWIGFEDSSVGRVVTADANGRPRTIWTTHDAGRTWQAYTFS